MVSLPDISCSNMVNQASFRPMTQAMENNRARRVNMASASPTRRPNSRCCSGRRDTRIEIKMMLSMPSTISSAVKVASAIQASGLAIHSNILFLVLF
jgi:hypothetical protein